MTLILSAYANGWSFQVSDRRLSLQPDGHRSVPVYDHANKSLILRTSDAVVTVGFTGLAHIRGVPTDTWVTDRLLTTFRDEQGRDYRALGRRRLNQLVAQLRRDLVGALATAPPSSGPLLLRLDVAGQRWDRGSPRYFSPISFSIDTVRVGGLTSVGVQSNGWRANWFRGLDPQMVFSSPPNESMSHHLNRVMRSGGPMSKNRFRGILIDALRRVAQTSSGQVGQDCMLIEILPSPTGLTHATVEFFPGETPMPALRVAGADVPLTFTPGVLTTRSYARPGIQNVDMVVPPVELRVVGLPERGGLPFTMYRGDLVAPPLRDLPSRPRLPRPWLPPMPWPPRPEA